MGSLVELHLFFYLCVIKVQDKFRLDLTDEQAVQYIQGVIDVSVTATFAPFVEQMHKLTQVWVQLFFHLLTYVFIILNAVIMHIN